MTYDEYKSLIINTGRMVNPTIAIPDEIIKAAFDNPDERRNEMQVVLDYFATTRPSLPAP